MGKCLVRTNGDLGEVVVVPNSIECDPRVYMGTVGEWLEIVSLADAIRYLERQEKIKDIKIVAVAVDGTIYNVPVKDISVQHMEDMSITIPMDISAVSNLVVTDQMRLISTLSDKIARSVSFNFEVIPYMDKENWKASKESVKMSITPSETPNGKCFILWTDGVDEPTAIIKGW